jgi:hypothetical protein
VGLVREEVRTMCRNTREASDVTRTAIEHIVNDHFVKVKALPKERVPVMMRQVDAAWRDHVFHRDLRISPPTSIKQEALLEFFSVSVNELAFGRQRDDLPAPTVDEIKAGTAKNFFGHVDDQAVNFNYERFRLSRKYYEADYVGLPTTFTTHTLGRMIERGYCGRTPVTAFANSEDFLPLMGLALVQQHAYLHRKDRFSGVISAVLPTRDGVLVGNFAQTMYPKTYDTKSSQPITITASCKPGAIRRMGLNVMSKQVNASPFCHAMQKDNRLMTPMIRLGTYYSDDQLTQPQMDIKRNLRALMQQHLPYMSDFFRFYVDYQIATDEGKRVFAECSRRVHGMMSETLWAYSYSRR